MCDGGCNHCRALSSVSVRWVRASARARALAPFGSCNSWPSNTITWVRTASDLRTQDALENPRIIGVNRKESAQRIRVAPVLASAIFVLGLAFGSFLNVCIYRLPRELSVVQPRSACPGCERPIAAYDNIPVLSWLILRGRCRNCRAHISPRYLIVEILSGAIFLTCYAH